MHGEVNSKEFNDEIDRKFNEANYICSEDLLPQIYNNQDIPSFAADVNAQGFLRFFESMQYKMLQKNPNADIEHQLTYIFDKWANLTDENRHVISCIAIIHNQEDCHDPMPDDLDIQTSMLLTFNVLECIVESLLENYGKYPTNNSASFEIQQDYWNNTPNNNIESNMVPHPDITSDSSDDIIIDEYLLRDLRVNLLEAYHASQLLLNLDENALLE